MAIYIIEATSTHKLWYALETDQKKSEVEKHAEDLIKNGTLKDFAQKWQGEKVETVSRVSKEGYIKSFDTLNKKYKAWTSSKKLGEVNKIKEGDGTVLTEDDL